MSSLVPKNANLVPVKSKSCQHKFAFSFEFRFEGAAIERASESWAAFFQQQQCGTAKPETSERKFLWKLLKHSFLLNNRLLKLLLWCSKQVVFVDFLEDVSDRFSVSLTKCWVDSNAASSLSCDIMGEREDNVYKAKLAEQAERYDGESSFKIIFTVGLISPILFPIFVNDTRLIFRN